LQRILSTAVIVGLLTATAAAFAITERLKLTKSPITGTKVVRAYLSPRAHTTAAVAVRFRKADIVTVTVQDSGRHAVDTLVSAAAMSRGRHTFTWDGTTGAGTPAPDGTYRFEVHLARQHRTILLPNPIALDTKPPSVLAAAAVRPAFSPDGDGQSDHVTIDYTLSEDAHALVFVDGHRIVKSRSRRPKDKLTWSGTVDGAVLPQGTYVLTIGAVDLAGNTAVKLQHVPVTLRYIELLQRRFDNMRRGGTFHVTVSTDVKRYHWSLGGRHGVSSQKRLKLRTPSARGRYVLTVTEDGHSDHVPVFVR
jgi:hypothetical protein